MTKTMTFTSFSCLFAYFAGKNILSFITSNLGYIFIFSLLFFCSIAYGQQTRSSSLKSLRKLQNQLQVLKAENEKLQKSLASNSQKTENQAKKIEDLNLKMSETKEGIETKANLLDKKIEDTSLTTNNKVSELNSSLSRNTIYWITSIGLLSLLSIGLFFWANRKAKISTSEIEKQIKKTKLSLQEESIRLDNKLAEILGLQLKTATNLQRTDSDVDHSLILKVANEINRMQMNLIHMDANVRGVKQLNRALNNMIDTLKNNGYEIIDLLGKPYDTGMNLIGTMEPDPKLKSGDEKIKRIIKPQVNFNNVMIQAGEVVIGYGE